MARNDGWTAWMMGQMEALANNNACDVCGEPKPGTVTWMYHPDMQTCAAVAVVHEGECFEIAEQNESRYTGRGFFRMSRSMPDAIRSDLLSDYPWPEVTGRVLRARIIAACGGRVPKHWSLTRVVNWKNKARDALA